MTASRFHSVEQFGLEQAQYFVTLWTVSSNAGYGPDMTPLSHALTSLTSQPLTRRTVNGLPVPTRRLWCVMSLTQKNKARFARVNKFEYIFVFPRHKSREMNHSSTFDPPTRCG